MSEWFEAQKKYHMYCYRRQPHGGMGVLGALAGGSRSRGGLHGLEGADRD